MDVLRFVLFFSLLIGPLVLFHELGHLLMAKKFGVKCTEFSIGFGPRIASWKPAETEYSLRILPLGGYVRMLGATEEDRVEDSDRGRSINDKPIWQRALIYLAGPVMNLLIPIPVFFVFLIGNPTVLPPVVGSVEPDLPAAAAGLEPGDRIVEIEGRQVDSFSALQRRISKRAGESTALTIDRNGERMTTTITPEATAQRDRILPMRRVERGMIGIHLAQYGPILHVDSAHTPAHQAGLRTFDRVLRVDGEPTDTFTEVRRLLSEPGAHTVELLRPQQTDAPWADVRINTPIELSVEGAPLSRLGIRSAQQTVWSVTPHSPAALAGLSVGDRVTALDGVRFADIRYLMGRIQVEHSEEHMLTVVREGETLHLPLRPDARQVVAEFQSEREEVFVGAAGFASNVYPTPERRGWWSHLWLSLIGAIRETFAVIIGLIYGVVYLFTGQVDSASVGGPIMIADVASQAARDGIERFIGMMALISVNLGVLNLLPIPGLDGGQLAVLGLEGIKRGPLSNRTRQIINFVGVAFIIMLMVFVFKNDIERYWAGFADWLNS